MLEMYKQDAKSQFMKALKLWYAEVLKEEQLFSLHKRSTKRKQYKVDPSKRKAKIQAQRLARKRSH